MDAMACHPSTVPDKDGLPSFYAWSFLAAATTSGESVTVCAFSVNEVIVSKLR